MFAVCLWIVGGVLIAYIVLPFVAYRCGKFFARGCLRNVFEKEIEDDEERT